MSPPITIHARTTDDEGTRHVVRIAGIDGPSFPSPALAALYAAQLSAAIAPLLAPADRARALLSDPAERDAVAGRCAAPASAVLATLRWVVEGPPLSPVLEWGDVPTLASEGMAVVVDGEGEA